MRQHYSDTVIINRVEVFEHGADDQGFFVACTVTVEENRRPFFRPTVASCHRILYREGDYTSVTISFKPGLVTNVNRIV